MYEVRFRDGALYIEPGTKKVKFFKTIAEKISAGIEGSYIRIADGLIP
jgi:hypothetical protein